jgi:hypothetical protein
MVTDAEMVFWTVALIVGVVVMGVLWWVAWRYGE